MNPNASSFVPVFGKQVAPVEPAPPVRQEPAQPPPQMPEVVPPNQLKTDSWEDQAAEKVASPTFSDKDEIVEDVGPDIDPNFQVTDEQLKKELQRMALEEGVDEADLLKEDIVEKGETLDVEDPREHVNIVFIGHVDAGKSTISGQILYQTGMVDARTIQRYEKEAKEKNRESWFLAYIMDTNEEERAKGKTVEVGRASFETKMKRYTILDAPGHKNYVPNMIGGAAQADIGILVISARKGEFETGFNKGGQTREHAMLAKTLGLKFLIIVINKMDDPTVEWAQSRYDEIVNQLLPFLKQVGYNPKTDVFFIPISGFKGANIKDPAPKSLMPWYTGQSLLDTLDALKPLERLSAAPLRIPLIDKFRERGATVVLGKVESGVISRGDKLYIMPNKTEVEVLGVLVDDVRNVKTARPGENIKVLLKGVDEEGIRRGFVLCDPRAPIPCPTKFEAQLVILDLLAHKSIFSAGYTAVMHIHAAVEECNVTVLLSQLDKKTGEVVKKRPMFVKNGSVVRCILETSQSVCCELFSDIPQLGRFTLRDEGKTIAIGKVISFGPKKKTT